MFSGRCIAWLAEFFNSSPVSFPYAFAGLLHASEEPRIVLDPVVQPIVFRLEADQYPGGLPMPRNDNFLPLCDTACYLPSPLSFSTASFRAVWLSMTRR